MATTPFNRLKNVGKALWQSVNTRPTTAVTNVGRTLQVNFRSSICVSLDSLASSAGACIADFNHSVKGLLSPEFSYALSQLDKISDNYSQCAPFKQEANVDVINALLATIWPKVYTFHGLGTSVGLVRKACYVWLDQDQQTLESCAAALCITSGVSPQQFQFHLQLDCSEDRRRDFYITPGKRVIWVNPFRQPDDTKFIPAAYVLPSAMTEAFITYWFIVRPIACRILRLLHHDISDYALALFVDFKYNNRKKSSRWDGNKISAAVENYTLPFCNERLGPDALLVIGKGLLERYFSSLTSTFTDTLVDLAAQHTQYTSVANYGRVAEFPPLPHFRFDQVPTHLNISLVWQCLLGFGPQYEDWAPMVRNSGLLPQPPPQSAVASARKAIKQYGDVTSIAQIHVIISQLPFINEEKVSASLV